MITVLLRRGVGLGALYPKYESQWSCRIGMEVFTSGILSSMMGTEFPIS